MLKNSSDEKRLAILNSFKYLDTNGDSVLTVEDYIFRAEKNCDALGIQSGDQKRDKFIEKYKYNFETL